MFQRKSQTAVFDYYSSRGVWKGFPFSPDIYSKVLYHDQGDIEDDTRALVGQLGMQFPVEYVLRESGNMPPTLSTNVYQELILWNTRLPYYLVARTRCRLNGICLGGAYSVLSDCAREELDDAHTRTCDDPLFLPDDLLV